MNKSASEIEAYFWQYIVPSHNSKNRDKREISREKSGAKNSI